MFLNDSQSALCKQIYCLSQPQERQPFLLSRPSLHCSLAARHRRHCLYAKGYHKQYHIVVRSIVDARTRTSTYVHTHTSIHTNTHTHTFKHTHRYTYTHINTHTHTDIHPTTPTPTPTPNHTHTHTYTHTHCCEHRRKIDSDKHTFMHVQERIWISTFHFSKSMVNVSVMGFICHLEQQRERNH